MEFWDVEISSDAKINEDRFVVVEIAKSVLEECQCVGSLRWILGDIQKIQDASKGSNETCRGSIIRQW